MRKYRILCLLAAVMLAVSSAGTTFAAYQAVAPSVHEIDLENIRARIVEEYTRPGPVYPGATVDKVVNVKNTGSGDAVIRVKVELAWGEARDADGNLIVNSAYATDNIQIVYDTSLWMYCEADGYFYYKGVLKPGETTQVPLFRAFTINKATGNEYAGLEADIVIRMECVQAAAEGVGVWNKTFADLGIVYVSEKPAQIVCKVTFTGEGSGFIIDPENTDLFLNFKQLFPGETRSQTIEVKNTYPGEVEIFLRAEDITQGISDPATLALINKLLREYAVIIVTTEDGRVIYKGPVWGEPTGAGTNPGTMRYDISLGVFKAGEIKKLNIQLQLDPNMDNAYQSLSGLIKWVWSASWNEEEVELPVEPPAPDEPSVPRPIYTLPKTGDGNTGVWVWAILTAVSAVAFAVALITSRRAKKEEYRAALAR